MALADALSSTAFTELNLLEQSDRDLLDTHLAFAQRHQDFDCHRIIDCGAARGSFAIPALVTWTNAQLLAVDPNVSELALLIERAVVTKVRPRLATLPAAVWSHTGAVRAFGLWAKAGHFGQTGLVFNAMKELGFTITTTLADVIGVFGSNEVDLLKLDIEGSEHVALPATPPEILRRVRYWQIDEHNVDDKKYFGEQWRAVDVYGIIAEAGFRCIEPPNLWKRVGDLQ